MITDTMLRNISHTGVRPMVFDQRGKRVPSAQTYPAFIKPGETPEKAIKRLMLRLKPKAEGRVFPKEFKSTADYIKRYEMMNRFVAHCLPFKDLRTDGFAIPEGPDVIVEEVEDELI